MKLFHSKKDGTELNAIQEEDADGKFRLKVPERRFLMVCC